MLSQIPLQTPKLYANHLTKYLLNSAAKLRQPSLTLCCMWTQGKYPCLEPGIPVVGPKKDKILYLSLPLGKKRGGFIWPFPFQHQKGIGGMGILGESPPKSKEVLF